MASATAIQKGTRLHIAYSVTGDREPDFTMMSTFHSAVDDSVFLIAVPMQSGKALEFDDTQKFLLRYDVGRESMFMSAFADDLVMVGARRYWKMRRVTDLHQFFQRKDERYKVALHVTYTSSDWPLNADGFTEQREGLTLDISAGGAALYLQHRFDVGDICELSLPKIGSNTGIDNVVCAICWNREAPKGSPFKNIAGLQFRFADNGEREKMRAYIDSVRNKYKL